MEQRLTVDATLAARLRAIQTQRAATGEGPTFADLSKVSGINRSRISEIAHGRAIPTAQQEAQLWDALKQYGLADPDEQHAAAPEVEQQSMPLPPPSYKRTVELYETKQFADALGWCDYIREKRKMGVLIGHPGSGKTTLLREFCRRVPGAHYIECWSTMRMGDLLGELALAAGVSLSGNVYQRTKQVMRALGHRTDVMIICDEAEQMRKWDVDKFETLRKIWDNTGTPVIMAGTTQLRNLLTRGGGRDNLAQLYRRKYEFEMTGMREKEVRAILRDYNLDADAAAELTRIATDAKHGGMGNFVEILGLCLDAAAGERIDGGIVAGAKRYKLLY